MHSNLCLIKKADLCVVANQNCAEVKPEICKVIQKAVRYGAEATTYGTMFKEDYEDGKDDE